MPITRKKEHYHFCLLSQIVQKLTRIYDNFHRRTVNIYASLHIIALIFTIYERYVKHVIILSCTYILSQRNSLRCSLESHIKSV